MTTITIKIFTRVPAKQSRMSQYVRGRQRRGTCCHQRSICSLENHRKSLKEMSCYTSPAFTRSLRRHLGYLLSLFTVWMYIKREEKVIRSFYTMGVLNPLYIHSSFNPPHPLNKGTCFANWSITQKVEKHMLWRYKALEDMSTIFLQFLLCILLSQ